MTLALAYAAIGLLAVSIAVSRLSARQLAAARKALAADEAVLASAGQSLQEALRALHDAEQRHDGLDARLDQAQAEVRTAQQALDEARRAPTERWHVFDRLEPRPGTLWSVTVARSPDAPGDAPWSGERACLIAAASQDEALERVALRYPHAAGFEVRTAVPCPLFPAGTEPRPPKRRMQ